MYDPIKPTLPTFPYFIDLLFFSTSSLKVFIHCYSVGMFGCYFIAVDTVNVR